MIFIIMLHVYVMTCMHALLLHKQHGNEYAVYGILRLGGDLCGPVASWLV